MSQKAIQVAPPERRKAEVGWNEGIVSAMVNALATGSPSHLLI